MDLIFGFLATQEAEGDHQDGERGSWRQEEKEKEMIWLDVMIYQCSIKLWLKEWEIQQGLLKDNGSEANNSLENFILPNKLIFSALFYKSLNKRYLNQLWRSLRKCAALGATEAEALAAGAAGADELDAVADAVADGVSAGGVRV